MRATHIALALALLLSACRKEPPAAQAPKPGSLSAEVAAAEAKYESYPAHLVSYTTGAMDGNAEIGKLSDLPGWSSYHWDGTPIAESIEMYANPENRDAFFVVLNGYKGDPEFPEDAAYLVSNSVQTSSTAPQAIYWCVTEGPYKGSALSVGFNQDKTEQNVFLKSPGFMAVRGNDYACPK